tara:strand:- start:1752 stop:2012 length:261 start_codon:yes stop_codon:yes gene_type:complete
MEQTAVEWLEENLISGPYSEEDFNYNSECWDKAKEMDKQQKIDAYNASQERMFDIMQEYAEFCVKCDREKLPLLLAKDWFEQFNNK